MISFAWHLYIATKAALSGCTLGKSYGKFYVFGGNGHDSRQRARQTFLANH